MWMSSKKVILCFLFDLFAQLSLNTAIFNLSFKLCTRFKSNLFSWIAQLLRSWTKHFKKYFFLNTRKLTWNNFTELSFLISYHCFILEKTSLKFKAYRTLVLVNYSQLLLNANSIYYYLAKYLLSKILNVYNNLYFFLQSAMETFRWKWAIRHEQPPISEAPEDSIRPSCNLRSFIPSQPLKVYR